MAGTVTYKVGATVLAADVPTVNGQATPLKWRPLDYYMDDNTAQVTIP